MSDQPVTYPAPETAAAAAPPSPSDAAAAAPVPGLEPASPDTHSDAPELTAGQLVSYLVVDDAGFEHTAVGLVSDVFTTDDVEQARVAPLPAALAIDVSALTAIP